MNTHLRRTCGAPARVLRSLCVSVGDARGRGKRETLEGEGDSRGIGVKNTSQLCMHRYLATARQGADAMRGATR